MRAAAGRASSVRSPPKPATSRTRERSAAVRQLNRPVGRARAWVRVIRVRQWSKNVLVFAAPAAADAMGRPSVLARTLLSFVVFCLLSAGVYLINDVRDAAEDREHPIKRHRPIASGAIHPPAAVVAAAGCMGVALAISADVGSGLFAVACGYACLNLAYSTWLRRIAIADIGAIAGAFVLRAVAGGVASTVGISHWFVLVVSFAALFVAAGKRYADILDPAGQRSRAVLEQYNADFLRFVIGVASAVALAAYALWALQGGRTDIALLRELTLVPFTLALLRYALLVSDGRGGAPESVIFRDRFMQLSGIVWLMLFVLGA
ncbi:MAG: decaprenyl-phosphate phosphoribosyltransferase [Solirubrobacteraceae bacterium]